MLLNPGGTYRNVLAGQVVALTISVTFDLVYPNFSSSSAHLQDLVIVSGTFMNWTVSRVLAEANKKLGGCYSPYSASQLNSVISSINENFDDGTIDNHFLRCPSASTRFAVNGDLNDVYQDEAIEISSFPNPFSSITTIEFQKLDKDSHVTIDVFNLAGEHITTLFDSNIIAGEKNAVHFDGSDLEQGIYIYRVVSGNSLHTGRLILIK